MGTHLRHRTGTHRATHPIGTGGKHNEKPYKNNLNMKKLAEEKEKIKTDYLIGEKELKRYTQDAILTSGNPVETLLRKLEMRLDNVLYRAELAQSRDAAQRLIRAGGIMVNDVAIDDPDYHIKEKDVVALRNQPRPKDQAGHHTPPEAPWLTRHRTSIILDHIPTLKELKGHVRAKIDDVLRYYAVV